MPDELRADKHTVTRWEDGWEGIWRAAVGGAWASPAPAQWGRLSLGCLRVVVVVVVVDRHLGGRTSLHFKLTPSRLPPLFSSPAPLAHSA